jgi:membrane-associated progesterone receptor component
MLTPIDQPLDKLEDLQSDEVYVVRPTIPILNLTSARPIYSDNIKGWIDHFSNQYIFCGKLVENDLA